MSRFAEESAMAQQLSVRPGAYPFPSRVVGTDPAQIVVRGDLARVGVTASKDSGPLATRHCLALLPAHVSHVVVRSSL